MGRELAPDGSDVEPELDEALRVLHEVRELAQAEDWTSLVSLEEKAHAAAETCRRVAMIRAYAKERSTRPGELIVRCLRAEGLSSMDIFSRETGINFKLSCARLTPNLYTDANQGYRGYVCRLTLVATLQTHIWLLKWTARLNRLRWQRRLSTLCGERYKVWSIRTNAHFQPNRSSAATLPPMHLLSVSRSFPAPHFRRPQELEVACAQTRHDTLVTSEQDLAYDCTAGSSQLYVEVCRKSVVCAVCAVCAMCLCLLCVDL